jgi:hypothetical protein
MNRPRLCFLALGFNVKHGVLGIRRICPRIALYYRTLLLIFEVQATWIKRLRK